MIFILYLFLFTALFYFIGAFIFYLFRSRPIQKKYNKFFFHTLTGITAFITVFALCCTWGNSVFLVNIVLAAGILFFEKNSNRHQLNAAQPSFFEYLKINPSLIFQFAVVALLIYFINYYFLFWKYDYKYACQFRAVDLMFYAHAAEFLTFSGIETFNFDYLLIDHLKPVPYHYFEIWLNAGLYFLTGEFSFLTQELISVPLMCSMIFIGTLALFENIMQVPAWIKFSAAGLLFFSGFNVPSGTGSRLLDSIEMFSIYSFWTPKNSVVYLFVLAAVISGLKNKFEASILIFISLGVASVATLPAVFAASIAVILLSRFKYFNIKLDWRIILFAAAVGIIYTGFYALHKNEYANIKPAGLMELYQYYSNSAQGLKTLININIKSLIQIFIVFAPFFIITLFAFRRFKKNIIQQHSFIFLFCSIAFFCGLFSWSVIHTMLGAVDFFYLLGNTILNIFFFCFVIIKAHETSNKTIKIGLLIFMTVWLTLNINHALSDMNREGIGNSHSNEYITTVAEEVKQLGSICAYDCPTPKDFRFIHLNYLSYPHRYYLGTVMKNSWASALYVFDYKLSDDPDVRKKEEEVIYVSSFGSFVKQQKEAGEFSSIEQGKLDFLLKNNIKYLFVARGKEIPSVFTPYIKKIITDDKSGERCIILK